MKTMIAQGQGGSIFSVSSICDLVAIAGSSSGYGATKAAVIQLTRQAALDGAPTESPSTPSAPASAQPSTDQPGRTKPRTPNTPPTPSADLENPPTSRTPSPSSHPPTPPGSP